MKNKFAVLLMTFLSACDIGSQNNISSKELLANDEAAIKSLIEAETEAYVNRDITLLMSYYAEDSITQSTWNQPDGTYGLFRGFERIQNNFRSAFKTNPDIQHMPNIQRADWFFRPLSNEWMWVNFVQTIKLTDGTNYKSYETRVMKKIGTDWKIAVMYALSDHGHASDKPISTPGNP